MKKEKTLIYNKVCKALVLYVQLWLVATFLAWVLVSIFGFGSSAFPIEDYGSDFIRVIWNDYTWGDFCFDAISMAVLIALSMLLSSLHFSFQAFARLSGQGFHLFCFALGGECFGFDIYHEVYGVDRRCGTSTK